MIQQPLVVVPFLTQLYPLTSMSPRIVPAASVSGPYSEITHRQA